MLKLANYVMVSLCFVGCESPRFENYSTSDEGVDYQLISIGKDLSFEEGEVLFPIFTVYTIQDSILLASAKPSSQPIFSDSINQRFLQALQLLNLGDSASFILKSKELEPWLTGLTVGEVKLNIKLIESKSKVRYAFEQNYPNLLVDYEMQEQEQLQQFLSKQPTDSLEEASGVYVIHHVQGKGKYTQTDDVLQVDYEGFLFNGEKFDSTKDRQEPLVFQLGEQNQVIEGFDRGIRTMKEGGEATFIIPSQLAFGDGSTSGIVPPHSSVIYKVKLLKINP